LLGASSASGLAAAAAGGSPATATVVTSSRPVLTGRLLDEQVDSVQVGREGHFQIQVLDRHKPRRQGGDEVSISFRGPDAVQAQLEDLQNGLYSVRFLVITPGVYEALVSVDGREIAGSPFRFTVVERPVLDIHANGLGLEAPLLKEPNIFTLENVPAGAELSLSINGPESVEVHVSESGGGVFVVEYVANVPGAYEFHVSINGEVVPNSPFRAVIEVCFVASTGSLAWERSRIFPFARIGPCCGRVGN
jgi:hypothetical protein